MDEKKLLTTRIKYNLIFSDHNNPRNRLWCESNTISYFPIIMNQEIDFISFSETKYLLIGNNFELLMGWIFCSIQILTYFYFIV